MKKLLSLLSALLLCLCSLTPALAEEAASHTANIPITLADYQKAYEAVILANAPEASIVWSTAPIENGEAHLATIDNSFVSVMLLPDGEYVAEVAVLMEADLTESALLAFLSMAGYSGAALLLDEDTDAETASQTFMNEVVSVFMLLSEGTSPEDICGLPAGLSITTTESGAYQFYFILKLNEDTAAE